MSSVAATRAPIFRPPAQPYARGRAFEPPSIVQFVVLSMLLHALFIALFGAPSGGSREGRAMWGSLRVLLGEPVALPAPSLKLDRGTAAEMPGVTATDRPPVEREPGYQPPRLPPVPAPTPLKLSPAKKIAPPVTPEPLPEAPPAEPAPQPPATREEPLPVQPLFVPLPRPESRVLPEVKAPVIPPTLPATPAEEHVAPAPVPPPPVAQPAEAPAPARVEAPPVEAQPIPAPILQPVQPAVVEPVATPPVERTPVEAPPVPVPPLERVVPPRVEPSTSQESAAPRAPRATPQPPPVERVEPRPVEREATPATEPAPRAPPAAPASPKGPEFDFLNAPRDAPRGAPDASKPGGIDLDAARRRARELAREGTGQRAILPFPMPGVPPKKSKEELALEKALKPDCQTAHKDLGLLAVVPLVANEFGEGNCRWR